MTNNEALRIAAAIKDAREQLLDGLPSFKIAFRQNVCVACKVADIMATLVADFDRTGFMNAAGLSESATASSEWKTLRENNKYWDQIA